MMVKWVAHARCIDLHSNFYRSPTTAIVSKKLQNNFSLLDNINGDTK